MLFSEPKIPQWPGTRNVSDARQTFQCSSASRKFLNPRIKSGYMCGTTGFSALQRAENSSIDIEMTTRKRYYRFSALQRAENSSIKPYAVGVGLDAFYVSVLFSEPKIPQSLRMTSRRKFRSRFSALQRAENSSMRQTGVPIERPRSFSALQRAENSSMNTITVNAYGVTIKFQCSSASRKFLNRGINDAKSST